MPEPRQRSSQSDRVPFGTVGGRFGTDLAWAMGWEFLLIVEMLRHGFWPGHCCCSQAMNTTEQKTFHLIRTTLFVASLSSMLVGCSSDPPPTQCDPDQNTGCPSGQACERVTGGPAACFTPVQVRGQVFDLAVGTGKPISGARIVAVDDTGAAISSVATSGSDGMYDLRLPTPRNASGGIMSFKFTLRADAELYQSFPGGLRPAIPTDVTTAAPVGNALVITNPTTNIGLIALPSAQRATISGKVVAPLHAGVLVVGGGSTAISDLDGSFVLFNVTPGAVTVKGYAAGQQLSPAMVTVAPAGRADVVLNASSTPLSRVSGSLSLVNAGGISSTSVVLMVKDTFSPTLERGEVPRGLRKTGISNQFTFEGVPDGDYTVIPSLDNDGAVRDPDTSISGTAIVNITVPNGTVRDIALPTGFKVTAALAVRGPGPDLPEGITTATPVFKWADDSSEDGYELRVFDSFGTKIWENLAIAKVTGSPDVSATYAGPALQPGMYYLFQALSYRIKTGRVAISRTEDLRGIFYLAK